LPLDKIITEAMVRNTIEGLSGESLLQAGAGEFDPTALLIYGGGGHGKALIELVQATGVYRIVGVVDDGLPRGQSILDVPVLGGQEALGELFAQGVRLAVNAVGGIGNVAIRIQVFERLTRAGFACPAVVHPRAILEPSASLAAGVQVFAQAYVGSEARIGFGSIVNTGAIVSHECQLDEFVNISPGALLAGQVQVGEAALIGMGVTINLNTKIGAGARIGNGATVKSDVPERGVVRAGSVWPD
jgi:sugar O-acyltransferase (sialic acid O-acetyltransferase NeuD family)